MARATQHRLINFRDRLNSPAIRWNGATLLFHLVGDLLGASPRGADSRMIEALQFEQNLETIPSRRRVPSESVARQRGQSGPGPDRHGQTGGSL